LRTLNAVLLLLLFTTSAFAQPYKVCTNDWPPFTMMENGEVRGIDADLLSLVLTNLGVSYEISMEPWKRCLYRMNNNDLDILLDAFYSQERAQIMIYPSEPTAETSLVLFYAKARPHTVNSVANLNGLRVGTEPGYAYANEEFMNGSHFVREDAPTLEANFGKLMRGRVDLVITDRTVGLYTAKKLGIETQIDYNPRSLFKNDSVYALIHRQSKLAELADEFDAELKRVKASPEYQQILQRYHYVPAKKAGAEGEPAAQPSAPR
jgi:polar amino acid transport system substrate-binding protein